MCAALTTEEPARDSSSSSSSNKSIGGAITFDLEELRIQTTLPELMDHLEVGWAPWRIKALERTVLEVGCQLDFVPEFVSPLSPFMCDGLAFGHGDTRARGGARGVCRGLKTRR